MRGEGGRGGCGGVGGALTGEGVAGKQLGDGSKAVAIEGAWWGRARMRERRKGGWCGVR
jgi:hypothetical protein